MPDIEERPRERCNLTEGARVHEQIKALTDGQASAVVLPGDPLVASHLLRGHPTPLDLLDFLEPALIAWC